MRYFVEPDPAWDAYSDRWGVLRVELSWMPDALAGRTTEIVASPELAAALTSAGLTGFRTGRAKARIQKDAFVPDGAKPPKLVRLVVGEDPDADLAYVPQVGLTVSEAALDVLAAHCRKLDATELAQ